MLDEAGNTVSDHHGARTFAYGPAGRLLEVREGNKVAAYRYNAFGLRVEKRTERGVTRYRYDQWGRLLSETTEDGLPRRDYVWAGVLPVAEIEGRYGLARREVGGQGPDLHDGEDRDEGFVGDERLAYLHTDPSGTPRLATDSKQSVVWRWEADAFGAGLPTAADASGRADRHRRDGDAGNADRATRPAVTINLRFPGQYFDAETRLHYNWMRYYNPGTGRYITSDPVGLHGGFNTYLYAAANPLRFVDPIGLCGDCCTILAQADQSPALPDISPSDPKSCAEHMPTWDTCISCCQAQAQRSVTGAVDVDACKMECSRREPPFPDDPYGGL